MSATTQTDPTEAEIMAQMAELDAGGVEMPSLIDGPTPAQVKSQSKQETEESDVEGQTEDTDESPEPGTESEDPEASDETEEETEETDETEETEEATEKTESKQQEEKQPQSKEQKEAARREKSWKRLESEKADLQKQKAELEKQKAELAQAQAKKPEPIRDEQGFTADDYEEFARTAERELKDADARGDTPKWTAANIELARVRAQGLRQREAQEGQEKARLAAQAEIQQTLEKYPELKKTDSPLAKAMQAEWENGKEFWSGRPGAMRKMAEIADLRVKADSVPGLEKKITELTKEVKRLNKLTSPSKGATPSGRSKASQGEEPNSDDLEAQLASWDREGRPLANI